MSTALSDLELRRYYDQQIRAWFGEVRPLRLEGSGRFFTPPPALPLRAVFVAPALSATYLPPTEAEPKLGASADILQWLDRQHRLVVLGDPGSGKSTLVSWLAWRLCAGLTEPLPDWCSGMLPVPMILRDMQLQQVGGFDDLLAAHVRTEMIAGHAALGAGWGAALQRVIETQPQTLLFLIDGYDELSQAALRSVRDALREGLARLPQARFVVTSRIVGYDENAIEAPPERPDPAFQADAGAARERPAAAAADRPGAAGADLGRLYVAPFDAARIRQFSRNWFEFGETADRRGEGYLQKFIDGLMRDPVALQLARIPNLLVMAAQVFGITNTLPDGRAKLYESITKAYLESIDQRYGLADLGYTLEQKTAWLAKVGYEMQSRRGRAAGGSAAISAGAAARDLLVAEKEVVAWLTEAMRESELDADESYVGRFVDAIARRSGLFIPRGEGQYAFAHLSIQEYFAALYLQASVRDLAVADPERLEALLAHLGDLAAETAWRETLITFFELPDWSPRVIVRLCKAVFGAELARVPVQAERADKWALPKNSALVELLARLTVNPGVTLPAALRQSGFARAVGYLKSERRDTQAWHPVSGLLGALTGNESGSQQFWALLRQDPGLLSGVATTMDLRGARMTDFAPLAEFTQLKVLWLDGTMISDLAPLAALRGLSALRLNETPIVSIETLAGLTQLRNLDLDQVRISDLSALSGLADLNSLSLKACAVTDLSPLAALPQLTVLNASATQVTDCTPLAARADSLWLLDLSQTAVSDLSPLAGHRRLTRLQVARTAVSDLAPLAGLATLQGLDIDYTGVEDLEPLRRLPALTTLSLQGTAVRSVAALAQLHNLELLILNSTQVSDLSPLAELKKLRYLHIHGTPVTDISALHKLRQLKIYGAPLVAAKAAKPWWQQLF